jgi:RHS repeat-associated protein
MKTKLTLTLLALAAVSFNLQAAPSSTLPAPLPEFMNDEQAAKWTADQEAAAAKETASTSSEQTPTVFYTGKPYVADAGGYIYKYRTYNPEMSRWTSADPSGFPDGVNNQFYAPNPANQLDALGLTVTVVNGTANPLTATNTDSSGNTYTITAGNVTAQNVSSANINTLNNLYSQSFSAGSSNVTVTVTSYYAEVQGGTGLGLSINLSVPSGYDFTQDITDTRTNNGNPPNTPFPDLQLTGSAISSNNGSGGIPNITPAAAAANGTEGDLGGGNWYDTPGVSSLSPSAVGTWTANLYIEQVSGSNYTVVGRVSYSYTISE